MGVEVDTGNQEGEMSLTVKAMDALDQTVTEWLKPGEEKTLTFNFLLPDDIEEKDYFAEYAMNPTLTPTLSQRERGRRARGEGVHCRFYHLSSV
ncbi:MAG: hypothetical protein HY578_04810 [Nitrospinae bacterium]|nr:hypothetical protein [Nitrospinota bacterium]